jgi:hypothetical protein
MDQVNAKVNKTFRKFKEEGEKKLLENSSRPCRVLSSSLLISLASL